MRKISFERFAQDNGARTIKSDAESLLTNFGKYGGRVKLVKECDTLGGVEWNGNDFLVFDAQSYSKWVMGITLQFWKNESESNDPDMTIVMGVMPGGKTRLSLSLTTLNSQKVFLYRTPGKLKTVVLGNKVDINEVKCISIGVLPFYEDQILEISNIHLTSVEPDYPLPDFKLVDDLGQYAMADWEGKTKCVDDLKTSLLSLTNRSEDVSFNEDWSSFGGWKAKQFAASGFFRTHNDGSRWWLIDPEGYAFISIGLDCVHPCVEGKVDGVKKFYTWLPSETGEFKDAWSDSPWGLFFDFSIANLIRAFGNEWETNWRSITRRRLIEWGFNTVGNWSDINFIKNSRVPYVFPLSDFPVTEKMIFRDFPDVFSDEYEKNSLKFAEELKHFKNDPFMIGYFLRNEPLWAFVAGLNIAEELLETDRDFTSKDYLIEYLKTKYNEIQSFNKAWNLNLEDFSKLKQKLIKAASLSEAASLDLKAFSAIMVERYVAIPSKACKAIDPDHLNLGMRYAYISDESLLAGCDNFDVFSINCYNFNPSKDVQDIGEMTSLPVMIGEFHFGALDRGLLSNSLRGVGSQEDRGKAYRHYVENAWANPFCVGTHYFTLNDQAILGRFDGENFQIGVVDVCQKPYREFVEAIEKTHQNAYSIAQGDVLPCAETAIEVPRNGF